MCYGLKGVGVSCNLVAMLLIGSRLFLQKLILLIASFKIITTSLPYVAGNMMDLSSALVFN